MWPFELTAQQAGGVVKRSPNRNKVSSLKKEKSKQQIIASLIDNMVYVDGGTYYMGTTNEISSSNKVDMLKHKVSVSGFLIGRYEVTQEEWQAVMGSNPSYFVGKRRPVEQISWDDCQLFIKKLNALTGYNFRLPTEAEWEYAARGGGSSTNEYPGSNIIDDIAWFDENSNGKTHIVGQKEPNELDLYDIGGNVAEWCQDWYGIYDKDIQTNPIGPSNGSLRCVRGGDWNSDSKYCRISNRNCHTPQYTSYSLGFRLAY